MKKKLGRPRKDYTPETIAGMQRERFKDGKVCVKCGDKKPVKIFMHNAEGYLLPRCKPCDYEDQVHRARIRRYSKPGGREKLTAFIARLQKQLQALTELEDQLKS